MAEYAIEARDLVYTYEDGTKALNGISFRAEAGKITGILGSNGAGKSTLFLNLNGVRTPSSGQVLLSGEPVTFNKQGLRRLRKEVGIVFQDPDNQLFSADVYRDISFGAVNLGLPPEEVRRRVEWAMEKTGVTALRDKPTHALSYGQKKRVAIAGVLVMEPRVIILDEPTAGQDFHHYTEIMEFLRGLNEQGVTVLMITHDMHLMLEYTPRALVFSDGHLIADKSAAEVLCDPALVEQAALKETSLFTLAGRCGIAPPEQFVQRFIDYDREVRAHGC